MGIKRQPFSPVGGNRNGVMRTADFYMKAVGSPDGSLSVQQWLYLPDYALAEAVNGEVFFDIYGEFSQIRANLAHMPEDVRLKRVAGNLLIMAQSGQYNFTRCLRHGEPEAAQLACTRFVDAAMKVEFLLRGRYMPYYKWSFRAMRQLGETGELADKLSFLLYADNRDSIAVERKCTAIEEIASEIVDELRRNNLTKITCGELERHAYSVNDRIGDSNLRNMHILAAVNE